MEIRQSLVFSNPANGAGVRRWDGSGRCATEWDDLRRDAELWLSGGNCFVHLYEKCRSRRGPSFCIPMKALKQVACGSLFTLCFTQKLHRSEVPLSLLSALKGPPEEMYELYVPAPKDLTREEAFQWHLTTRNFFAFVLKKPLVGTHLGSALIDLQERIHLFRSTKSSKNYDTFMEYAEEVGYRNFVNRPHNALAMLYYAERYKLKSLWTDAYVHCVGMNETLHLNPEYDVDCPYYGNGNTITDIFQPTPSITKALITRAYLEMDLHLGYVSKALSNFMKDELSPSTLSLTQGAGAHLKRFRSFLRSFCIEKFGYWPPPKETNLSKALYSSMYLDFRGLYDFLADLDSSDSLQSQQHTDGRICVMQSLQAFNKRHKYTPLPYPLPLLPAPQPPTKFGHKQTMTHKQLMARASLFAATNWKNASIVNAPLVCAYRLFECDWTDKQMDNVSMSDARRVCWILVYATLQMLISVTRAPPEVRDTEGAYYPLCCLTAGTPPWASKSKRSSATESDSSYASVEMDVVAHVAAKPLLGTPAGGSSYSLRRGCEAMNYVTHTNQQGIPRLSSHPFVSAPVEVPAPLHVSRSSTSPLSRSSTIRHSISVPTISRNSSWSSVSRSISPFTSHQKNIHTRPQPRRHIQVSGYGNDLNGTSIDSPSSNIATLPPPSAIPSLTGSVRRTSLPTELTVNTSSSTRKSLFIPSTKLIVEADEERTPTLESTQLGFNFGLIGKDFDTPIRFTATCPSSALAVPPN